MNRSGHVRRIFLGLSTASLISLTTGDGVIAEEDSDWTFLSTTTIGASQFIGDHPEFDGRGVVIAVMDTGVDMGVPGLAKTSTGETKVIDAQDFSGEGDVSLEEAEILEIAGENWFHGEKNGKLRGAGSLKRPPIEESELYIGFLEEKAVRNSAVADLNNNGRKDDRFGILAYETSFEGENAWVACVDTNGDGNLADENVIRDYKTALESFQLGGRDPESQKNLLTLALNLFPEDKKAVVHFDDGGHGTHVAGIAAGYRLKGQEGFNGIAPGAKVISLKIGNNSLSGGATTSESMKKAIEYGIRYAEENDVPLVFNMSYGIGSEIPGRADIETLIDRKLRENPRVAFCTSHGNEGPGIGSTGLPAASAFIFTAGALLDTGIARDSYGRALAGDRVFHFSCRGGHVDKPDGLAPGAAHSAVPPWESGDRMNGTSMASPQCAGAHALLMSAAVQTDPPLSFSNVSLKRALKNSARELPGYTRLDQGAGVLSVGDAFELMRRWAADGNADTMTSMAYEISTYNPAFPDELGTVAYWHFGTQLPVDPMRQDFTVKAVFPENTEADEKSNFYRAFKLRSTADWLTPDKKNVFIRGEGHASIGVRIDPAILKTPGLHVGRVIGVDKNSKGEFKENTEFDLVTTVVIPRTFGPENRYRRKITAREIQPGDVHRHFTQVPEGATAMHVRLNTTEGRHGVIRPMLHDPAGRRTWRPGYLSSDGNNDVKKTITRDELLPGIWEIDVYADFAAKAACYYDLEAVFAGTEVSPLPWMTQTSAGNSPAGNFEIMNRFDTLRKASAAGQVLGITRTSVEKAAGEKYRHEISLNGEFSAVEIRVELTPETFNKFTDLAANFVDKDKNALVKDGMGNRFWRGRLNNPDSSAANDYRFELWGAFADEKNGTDWELKVTEIYYYNNPVEVEIRRGEARTFSLPPGLPVDLDFEMNATPPVAPDNYLHYGEIYITDSREGEFVESIPVMWNLGG